jgi:hypothetical protein
MTDINIKEITNAVKNEILKQLKKDRGFHICSVCSTSSIDSVFSKYNKYCLECFQKKSHDYYINTWKTTKYIHKSTGRPVGRPKKIKDDKEDIKE